MRLALVAALATLPGCVFYVDDGDDQPPSVDAGWWPSPDAWPQRPDADIGDGPCDLNLTCPAASPNRVSVCGRILDVETSQPVEGPAVVDITPYDALEFAGNPNGATPLAYEDKLVDACGRFRLHNINRPSLGFLGLAVDDPSGGTADTYAMGAVAFAVGSGENRNRERVFAIRHATDAQWTSQAGLIGQSFVTRGALLAIFLDEEGEPVAGVTVTEAGATEPQNDYYFAGANPWTRTTVNPSLTATGANGSALKIDSALVEHSGEGNCVGTWDSALAASIPDVLFVTIRHCFLGP